MRLSPCPRCTSPIPMGKSECPHCGHAHGPMRSSVHLAALGAAMLGLVACSGEGKSDTEADQPLYGAAETQSDSDGTDTDDTENTTDTESEQDLYGVTDTE